MLARRRAAMARLVRDTRADTALEFAMIGAAFFLFIFAIFVFSLDMFWQMTLDDAVRNAARQVAIGRVVDGPDFVTAVCNEFGVVAPNCTTSLQYSVQSATTFGAIPAATLSSAGVLSNSATFNVISSTLYGVNTSNGTTTTTLAEPQFLLVQVAYLVPFRIFAVPAGVATENGTPSLLSTVAGVMQ